MEKENLKAIISNNITLLRVGAGMTQLEMAGKLNYSDKTVSKWERGEALPDVTVLWQIADMFGVTLDYLCNEHEEVDPMPQRHEVDMRRWVGTRAFVTGMSLMVVWLVASLVFAAIKIAKSDMRGAWIPFVWAVPVTMIVWLILNTVWFSTRRNYAIVSLLMWTTLGAVYTMLAVSGYNAWSLFWPAIPGQIIILLWYGMGRLRAKTKPVKSDSYADNDIAEQHDENGAIEE